MKALVLLIRYQGRTIKCRVCAAGLELSSMLLLRLQEKGFAPPRTCGVLPLVLSPPHRWDGASRATGAAAAPQRKSRMLEPRHLISKIVMRPSCICRHDCCLNQVNTERTRRGFIETNESWVLRTSRKERERCPIGVCAPC